MSLCHERNILTVVVISDHFAESYSNFGRCFYFGFSYKCGSLIYQKGCSTHASSRLNLLHHYIAYYTFYDMRQTWAVFAQAPSPLFRTLLGPIWLSGDITLIYGANAFDGCFTKVVQYQRNAVVVELEGALRGSHVRPVKVWVRVLHTHLLQPTHWAQHVLNLLNLKFRITVPNTTTPTIPSEYRC